MGSIHHLGFQYHDLDDDSGYLPFWETSHLGYPLAMEHGPLRSMIYLENGDVP